MDKDKTQNRTSLSKQFTKINMVMAIIVAFIGVFSFWLNASLTEYFILNNISNDDLHLIYEDISSGQTIIEWGNYGLEYDSYAEVMDKEYMIKSSSTGAHAPNYQYSVREFNELVGDPELDVIIYYPFADDSELFILVMPIQTSFIPYQATLISLFIFILGLFATVKVFSSFSARQLISPIEDLSKTVHSIKNGAYGTQVKLNSGNDLDYLANDINELSTAIDTEIRLRESLESSRQQLILDISHDLKTPLTNIIGYSESLGSDKNLSKEDKPFIEAIIRNGHRANTLLNDLFTYSKLNATHYEINLQPFNLNYVLEDYIASVIEEIESASKKYDVDLHRGNYPVHLDIQLFRRVLSNIVDNFLRHSGNETTIQFVMKLKDGDAASAQLDILDNGIGIPEEDKEKIFDEFYRADHSRSVQTGGSGLGLSISKKIVHLHGGDIQLMPTETGSHFRITLPLNEENT